MKRILNRLYHNRSSVTEPDTCVSHLLLCEVTLGSRSMLCVNEDVQALKSRTSQNERCTEMKDEKKKEKRCPYLTEKATPLHEGPLSLRMFEGR